MEKEKIVQQTKDVGYTTTLKLMQIMHEKGFYRIWNSGNLLFTYNK